MRHALVPPATALLALHDWSGTAAGFGAGLLHPVSGLDHVVAMIAVGLWGAQLGAPYVWALPIAFPMVMAAGGALALIGVPLPAVEVGIALSAVVLGGLVLAEARPPLAVAASVVGAFALFHGYAHGTELPPDSNGAFYSAGFVVSTGALHAAGIGLGLVHRFEQGRRAIRAVGLCVALTGLVFLWRALA